MDGSDPIVDINHGAVEDAPTTEYDSVSKLVTWIDVSKDSIITDGNCKCQPKKCDAADGYHLTNIDEDMNVFLMVQKTYIPSMQTIVYVY